MTKCSFLASSLAKHIHTSGRRMDWWPYENSDQVDQFIRANAASLRGNEEHILVGLDHNGSLVVQEIRDITDAANISEKAFVLSYRYLSERVIHETAV